MRRGEDPGGRSLLPPLSLFQVLLLENYREFGSWEPFSEARGLIQRQALIN